MLKQVRVNIPASEKMAKLCSVYWGGCSDTEIKVLSALWEQQRSLSVVFDISAIKPEGNISYSAFNTALHRLQKRGILVKNRQSITLHPVFKAMDCDEIILSFQ